MSSPVGDRRHRRVASVLALGAAALVGSAAAQRPGPEFDPSVPATGAMAGTLVVGCVLLLVARTYTTRTTDRIRASPVRTFLYGFGILLLAFVALLILSLSAIGIVLAIPLLITMAVFAALGFLAAGRVVARNWMLSLVVAMLLAGVSSAVPVIGPVVGTVLASMGLGAAYLHRQDDAWRPASDARRHGGEPP